MKPFLLLLAMILCGFTSFSQNNPEEQDTNTYRIIKSDGGEIYGKILKKDPREILVLTTENREIIIPQHVIKEIVLLKGGEMNKKGKYIGEDKFATRYFISTNGLPIKKGEHYVQWNLFGPDFQFSIADDLGVGVMTSWIGIPFVGSIKKNWEVAENIQVAVGALAATFTWASPRMYAALPFGALSFGDRQRNLSFSGGYGFINLPDVKYLGNGKYGSEVEGRFLTSIAGMIKITSNISLVFESFMGIRQNDLTETFIYPDYNYDFNTQEYTYFDRSEVRTIRRPGFALIIPGLRWHLSEGKAFQFGFAGIVNDGVVLPVPLPMVQWYRSL